MLNIEPPTWYGSGITLCSLRTCHCRIIYVKLGSFDAHMLHSVLILSSQPANVIVTVLNRLRVFFIISVQHYHRLLYTVKYSKTTDTIISS